MASLMPEQDLLGRALTTDDPVQLLTQVKKALLNEPDDPIALAAQGVVLQKSGDPSSRADALSALLKAAHEASDDFVIWPRVAHAVHSIGLTDAYLDELKSRANQPEATATDWRLLGKFQFFLDRNDDAVASLIEATTRDASSEFGWFELARAAVDAQNPDTALDALKQMVRLDPETETVPMVEALKVAALSLGGRQLEALDLWRASQLPLEQSDVQRSGIRLAEILASKHPQDAIEIIDQIESMLAAPSARWVALRIKTQALLVAARYDESLAVLEIADSFVIDEQEKAGVRFWQAVALERMGRPDDALRRVDDALSHGPSDNDAAVIHLVRARLLNARSEYQRALDDVRAIKPELLPEEVRAEFSLHQGIALFGLGETDLALPQFEEARALGQNTPLFASILYWHGRGLSAKKLFDQALNAFAAASQSGFPESQRSVLYNGEALALWGLGKIDAALEKLDQGIKLTSNKKELVQLLVLKARMFGPQKNVEAALAALDSALTISTDETDQGMILIEKAMVTQAAGPKTATDALQNADAALAALGEDEATRDARCRALGIRAWALKIGGDHAGALATLERIAKLEPKANNDLEFISLRWETLLILGKNKEALELIQGVVNGDSVLASHPVLRIALGETLRRMGNLEKYFEELARATEVPSEHAGDAKAFFAAAIAGVGTRLLMEAGDALEHLKALDATLFNSPPVRVIRAQVLAAKGEFQAALELANDNPELEGPWRIMAAQTRAQALSEMGELEQALAATNQIIDLAAKTPETDPSISIFALSMKATYLLRLNRYEDALAAVSSIDNLSPGPGMKELIGFVAGISSAMVLNRLGQNDEALLKINSAIEAERAVGAKVPGAFFEPGRTIWIKGLILFELEREEEALRSFEQAQAAGLPDSETLLWQGRTLLALEDADRALRVFEAAVKSAALRQDSTQQFEALVGKGRALHDSHTYDAAIAAYREALRVGEQDAEASVQYWRRLGESYYALERYVPALRAYRRGWQIKPNADVARGISAVLIRQKQYGEAHRFFEAEGATFAAEDPWLKHNCALALWGLGKKERAKRIITEASEGGVVEAAEFLSSLKPKREGAEGWWDTWFGDEAGKSRLIVGCCLLLAVASALAAPVVAYFQQSLDWKATLVPAAVGLVLLLIPSIKGLSLSTEGVKLDIEPSLAGNGGDAPKPDFQPLGSELNKLFTASLGSLGKPAAQLRQNQPDDPDLVSGGRQMLQIRGSVVFQETR